MDVQKILGDKLVALPEGEHTPGLSAVRTHIDAAIRHFVRGQHDPDETLFTDVIFRCNQAFEGSIKEAYRVLAEQNPAQVRPYDIEQYLAESNLLRQKVLDQFKRYRQEWRNPSAHDYTLDFDEDEALLAIVSVTVFAIVLIDQIAGKLAFNEAAAVAPPAPPSTAELTSPLLNIVSARVLAFLQNLDGSAFETQAVGPRVAFDRASQFEGALAGYLASEFSQQDDIRVDTESRLAAGAAHIASRVDVSVMRGAEIVVLELKMAQPRNAINAMESAIMQLLQYLQVANVVGGVAVVYAGRDVNYVQTNAPPPLDDRIRIVSPERSDRMPANAGEL